MPGWVHRTLTEKSLEDKEPVLGGWGCEALRRLILMEAH